MSFLTKAALLGALGAGGYALWKKKKLRKAVKRRETAEEARVASGLSQAEIDKMNSMYQEFYRDNARFLGKTDVDKETLGNMRGYFGNAKVKAWQRA